MATRVGAAAGLAFALAASAAGAQTAPNYAGKTITVLIGSEPNGGFDTYGRAFAQFLGKYLPGRPEVVVQNMPGAGSILAVNAIANVAPRDGTEIGVIGQVAAVNQVLNRPGVHYDVRKLLWVGRFTSNSQTMFAWSASGVHSMADAMKRQVIVAGTSAASTSVIVPRMMDDFIGAKFKVVSGYKGSASATLAVERGEAQAAVRPWNDIKAKNEDWVKSGKISLIVQFALHPAKDLQQVPTVVSLVHDPKQRAILDIVVGGGDVGYSVIAPPGLSAPVAQTLRTAFDKVMADPKFLALAHKERLTLDPLSGAELQKVNERALEAPAAAVAGAKAYFPPG